MKRKNLKKCIKERSIWAVKNAPICKSHDGGNISRHCLTAFMAVVFLFVSLTASGQQREITGTVTDAETSEPLAGVNVVVKGTTKGVITDMNGEYSLNIQENDSVLMFSFIGYIQENVQTTGRSTMDVQLTPDIQSLDEVVVVGYGTMRKSDVTGSIVSISEEDFSQVKTTNVIENLQGKAAGVDITRSSGEAGSGFSILVRGERSLSGSNAPLYIVDGIRYGSGIDINPNDIESIEILKDVSSTAIYGAQGANGVVIITTKKGKPGQTKISFGSYVGINQPLGELPYMDRNSYLQYKEDLAKFKEFNSTGEWPDEVEVSYQPFEEEGIANGTDTDWLDLITRNGSLQNYFLSASGGREGIAFNVSLDYTNELGMLEKDNFKRYVLKGGMDVEVNDRLNIGTSSVLSYRDRNRMSFPEKNTRLMNPLAVPYDEQGELLINPTISSTAQTPLWYYQDGYYNREELTSRIFSSVYANLEIFEGLTLNSTFNADIATYRSGLSERAGVEDVNVEMFIKPDKDYTWLNLLTFNKTFGHHHLQITGGHEMRYGNSERYRITGINPSIDNSLWYALDGMDEISVGLNPDASGNDKFYYSESSNLSFLGRANYTLMKKYVFSASIRYDGSSVLAEGNKWDYFPAASVAWNASEEDFLQSVHAISMLKFRLGYGVSGNYAVPAYSSISMVNTSPLYYEFGSSEQVIFGYRPVYAGNLSLSWEKTTAYNFGIDFGFIGNRISGNIDIYQARTTDLLQRRSLPPHAAIPSIFDNVGETQTQGMELMLHSVNVSSGSQGGFKWTTDLSFTRNNEEIISLASGVDKDEANGWFVGEPVRVVYDYEKTGIWQLADSSELALYSQNDFTYGDIKIRDQNNDSIIDENDRVVLGQRSPKWYGSFTNRFEFKGIDLSVMVMARMGHTVNDNVMLQSQNRDNYAESGMEVDYWTPVNQSNESPRLDPAVSQINYMPYASSMLYTSGSWMKVRDITLGYSLPAGIVNRINATSLRIYVSAKNAFVLYSPLFDRGRYDPEKNGGTSWPTPKTFMVGLNLDF